MEIIVRAMFSSKLQGTFLFLVCFSLPSLSLSSNSTHEASALHLPRRFLINTTPGRVVQQYLMPHNVERAKLGLPPLRWSNKLTNYASWWAHQRQWDCALVHSNSNYGENLFWGSGRDWRPGDAVEAWATEKFYYDYNANACTQGRDCLHYTQMVWRQSLKVGCARVLCVNGDTFISCNYYPHGNVLGQRPF